MLDHANPKARPLVVGSIFLAAIVACALCIAALAPANAYAAGTKSAWVVTTQTTKYTGDNGSVVVNKFSYKDGLITSYKWVDKFDGQRSTHQYKYTYDKKFRITKETEKNNGKTFAQKVKFTYNKKGYLVKRVSTPKGSDAKYVSKYSYNSKGQLTKTAATFGTEKYFYDAKGNVKTVKENSDETGLNTYKFQYDAKGNIIKRQQDSYDPDTYVNTYKGSRLVKQVAYDVGGNKVSVTTYKYKKVTVPKKAIKMVKGQQKWITSGTVPFHSIHC